jgi:hypothetical protein
MGLNIPNSAFTWYNRPGHNLVGTALAESVIRQCSTSSERCIAVNRLNSTCKILGGPSPAVGKGLLKVSQVKHREKPSEGEMIVFEKKFWDIRHPSSVRLLDKPEV